MKLPVIIICILLAGNVYASQAKDSEGNGVRQEAKDANSGTVQQQAPSPAPSWAGANAESGLGNDEGMQPSYDHTDEPSFGDDGHRE